MSTQAVIAQLCIIESSILGMLFFLTFFGYPGWIKIALIKIRGKQYLLRLTRDNELIIEGAKEVEGSYQTSTGVYELEPEDTFQFNGRRAAAWYAPYNRAVNAKVMPLLRDLKKFGLDHYGQLVYFLNTPSEKIREEFGESAAETADTLKSYDGKILQDLEVIRIPDLKNYLESRSPSAENGIIERYIAIERRKFGNPLKSSNMILMLILAALLGLCIGYMMGGSSGSSGAVTAATSALSPVI